MRPASAVAVCLGLTFNAPALAAERVTIDYTLPSATITAGVAQRITKCPAAAEAQFDKHDGDTELRIEFNYKVAIAGKLAPRRLVMLDAESGFLVDRETKVHFVDDWYLKDFNGKTTGQGGPMLVSLIKAGAAIAAMSANPILGVGAGLAGVGTLGFNKSAPPPQHFATRWYLECRPEVVRDLAAIEKRRNDVSSLEARVIAGDGSAATQELLVLRRSQVDDLEAALTVNATLKGGLTPTINPDGTTGNLTGQIAAADITRWFRVQPVTKEVKEEKFAKDQAEPTMAALLMARDRDVPGLHGYQVSVTPDTKIATWFGCNPRSPTVANCTAEVANAEPKKTRDLVFLRPIPAAVKLWPNPAACAASTVCPADDKWVQAKGASGTASVKLPQLSRLYTMRTGGSIFGGRTVGAEFGPMSEPTMLQYNIGSVGKDVAGVIDAGVAGAQTMRNAEGDATKRKLDQLKNARDLQDLLDELDEDAS